MDNKGRILITKHSGEQEYFSTGKLVKSLRSAGATEDTIDKIVTDVKDWIFPGATTKQIYGRAHRMLHKEDKRSFRYRLKQAIYELGPTGYPFEYLTGEIYRRQDWEVEVGQVLQGASVTHEMDVIATKDSVQHLVECKYHKDQGKQVSIQVPLYVRSRVNDIIEYRKQLPEYAGVRFVASVATNTRFSDDSIQYGQHSGIKLLAWDFPEGNGLKNLVERYHIYPITILKDLSQKDKQYLLNHHVVLCCQLNENPEILDEVIGMTRRKKMGVRKELGQMFGEDF